MKNLIVVIGGSSGIGKSVCDKLNSEYHVVNMSRRTNSEVDNIYCDVTNIKSIKSAFIELNKKYGIPYALIYCSGFVEVQSIYELTEEALLQTFQTNILGAFRCVQAYVKLNKADGKIVLIASTSGMRPSPSWSAYSASKSALINLGLTLSEELKTDKKKVYIISPARTATELRRKLAPTEDQTMIMQPIDISNHIYYLLKFDNVMDGQNIVFRK